MITTPSPLPNDVDVLKQLVADRDGLIAKLLAEIARLKRWQFGRSSERLDAALAQLQLALGDLPAAALPAEPLQESLPAEESTQAPVRSRVLPLRRAPRSFPAHLPRETVVHAPASCDCPDCGSAMRRLGEDVSEMLDLVPGYFKVIRHVRPKLSCGRCARVIQEPAPSRPIDRGMAAPGLLAQIIVAKYADHCPLYRQQGIYRRSGVDLDRATLAAWVGSAAQLLEPLVDALGIYVRAAEKVHADDTPVPVLDPGRGKTKTGRLWTYVRDDRPAGSRDPPAVWYRYSPDRQSEHPHAHLRGFRGILQADAYSGFARLYEDGTIAEAACWAHARRKFYDLYVVERSPIATEALQRIGALYAVERDIRGHRPALRARGRQERAGPLLDALHAWLAATLQTVSAKSDLAGAIKYALVRWSALTRYRDDGRIEIDNNSAERSIRKKGALVAGSRNVDAILKESSLGLRDTDRRFRSGHSARTEMGAARSRRPPSAMRKRARPNRSRFRLSWHTRQLFEFPLLGDAADLRIDWTHFRFRLELPLVAGQRRSQFDPKLK